MWYAQVNDDGCEICGTLLWGCQTWWGLGNPNYGFGVQSCDPLSIGFPAADMPLNRDSFFNLLHPKT